MNRGPLRISVSVVASIVAIAASTPATAATPSSASCAKQTRAVASAKKAVTKAQKAKASSPAARKQRAKRVKAAKAKHTRARKALRTCKGKASPAPAPAPVPAPAPAPAPVPEPAPPALSLAATTVGAAEAFNVTVAAPALPAGTVYRLMFRSRGSAAASCSFLVIRSNVPPIGQLAVQSTRPWCAGPGQLSLRSVAEGAPPNNLGTEVAAVDVVVNPA